MTVTAPPPAGGSARERIADRWARWRFPAAIGAVVLVIALALAALVPRGRAGDLDPDSPQPRGARAVAQILGDRGVDVRRVTRTPEAGRLAGADAALVVVRPDVLGPEQLRRLQRATWQRIVLVQPNAATLDVLAPTVRPAGVVPGTVRGPDCAAAPARAAGRALAGGRLYRADTEICYPDPDRPATGAYAVTVADGRPVTVIGQARAMTNERLADDGNAALVLTTLGASPRLVWLMSDPLEAGAGGRPPTLSELAPRWIPWVVAQLVVAVLLTLLWRGRRLGRLVPEPLPVVVRAAETEEGRARLYRQSGARGRAAATLRTATLRRLAARLAVPSGTAPEQVAALVATATGRPDAAVRETLLGAAPARDADLVALADELDALEREVRAGAAGAPTERTPPS